jgi:hypothetical protein
LETVEALKAWPQKKKKHVNDNEVRLDYVGIAVKSLEGRSSTAFWVTMATTQNVENTTI